MEMKVGNVLVKEKIISEAQLEEALRNQVIFGGKVGTNLIELGYITPEQLAEYLSRYAGVPQVRPGELHSIPPEVIALIPAETAKKHQVLPVRLDKKRLSVAMSDPSDLATVDKLSFMTGMYINPLVIPELLLIMALERYYKIKRETRYIAVARDMRREPRVEVQELNIRPAPATKTEKKQEEEEFIEIPEFDGFHKVDIPEAPEPEPIAIEFDILDSVEEPAAPRPEPKKNFEPEPSAIEFDILDSVEESVEPGPEPKKNIEPEPSAIKVDAVYNITDMCDALAGATARDAIGEALMEYLRRRHFRAALLLPKESMLTGWLAAEESGYVEGFADFRVEMATPSSFLQVIESRNFCMGQLLSPTDLKAASAMGAKDNPAILLPIVLMNRVVAILCVIDTLEKLTRSLNELQKIAMKSAMAFEILIMRNKIQMV